MINTYIQLYRHLSLLLGMIALMCCYILQASTHFLHASTHALQCSPCLAHSAMQASQHFTHIAHSSSQNCESLAHNLAQSAHMSAQSMHTFAHPSISFMDKHMVVHFSHSTMQAKQASMQFFIFFILKIFNCERISTIQ